MALVFSLKKKQSDSMRKSITPIALAFITFAMLSCSDHNIEPKMSGNEDGLNTGDPSTSMTSHQGTEVAYTYEALPNGTVRMTFQNTTGHTLNGDLIREGVSFLQNGTIITEFSVPAGSTYTYIDDNVVPNETYRYIFEYFVGDTGDYEIFFDEVTVVSDIPALGNFILVAPSNDDEYDVLTNGYTIVIGGTNIKVEANADRTGSVVFYLNGRKFKDNTSPFALFREVNGDYERGRLRNGTYTLTAIAYPRNNGRGVAGDTATVNFTVNNIYQDGE
jgi:hypothetical protein